MSDERRTSPDGLRIPFGLDGRVALVTGGNGGIGLALAQGLASAGADVAIWGTDSEKNERAVSALQGSGTRVYSHVCDISDEQAVDAAFAATIAALGQVDSCFANAGTGGAPAPLGKQTFAEWRRVMAVNLDGTFLTFRAAARHMIERGEGGSLVATSSLTAVEAAPRSQHYAASKAGVIALVKTLAVELARHRIRSNALMPGWVKTDLTRPLLESDLAADHILPRIPLRRPAEPADLAAAAVYLAAEGSRYHTGDVLVIDGGYRLF
ncbi:MAG: SDR family NAD(P)-dependent oxidoreductase [Solirubrobacteraceae bacterium]